MVFNLLSCTEIEIKARISSSTCEAVCCQQLSRKQGSVVDLEITSIAGTIILHQSNRAEQRYAVVRCIHTYVRPFVRREMLSGLNG